jgi:hypothetical protein
METPLTFARFHEIVGDTPVFATFDYTEEILHRYFVVGDIIYREKYEKRTTCSTYDALDHEMSDLVISYYTRKQARKASDDAIFNQILPLIRQLSGDGRQWLRDELR